MKPDILLTLGQNPVSTLPADVDLPPLCLSVAEEATQSFASR
jgi:hypothetical protein